MNGKWIAGSLLMLVAGVILLVSIFVSWYAINVSSPQGSAAINLLPDNQVTAASPQYSLTETYSASHLNHTGTLYTSVAALAGLGGAIGIAGGALGFALVARPQWRNAVLALGIVALIVAVVAPVVLLASQPGALSTDTGHSSGFFGGSGMGPQSSFFGSTTIGGATETWGPAIGWYLAFVAGVLALVGALLARSSAASPETEESMAPADGTEEGSAETTPSGGFGPPQLTCAVCQARFWTTTQLDAHMQNSHPREPYQPQG
ncbi:MAG TPA: hypothetical protein VGV89_07860 [Thermoplasmata archaeon]|nr:hypothetical protein [Thermoplasmata archaeon]